MAGYPLSAPTVYLGWGYNQPVSVLNRGPIAAPNLDVYAPGQTFNLNASDNVTTFNLSGGTCTAQQPGLHAEPLQWCAGDDDRDGQREQQRDAFPAAAHTDAGGLHDAQRRAQRAAIFDTGHGGLWSVRADHLFRIGVRAGQRAQPRSDHHRQPQCLCRGPDVQPQPLGQRDEFQFVRRHVYAQQPGLYADTFQQRRRRPPCWAA